MTGGTLRAPWTTAQVDSLNAYQECNHVHPYTCMDSSHPPLVATIAGWVCTHCIYRQFWCHRAHAESMLSLSERANKMWWCMAKRREFSAMDCCNDCVPLPVDERPCLRNPRTYDDGPTDKGYDSRTFWICSKHDTSGYGLHTCLPCLHESLANQSLPIPGFESGCGYRRSYLEYDHQ